MEDVTKRYSITVSLNLSASEEEYSAAKLVYIPPFSIVENATVKRSFELLYYHGEIIKRLARALYLGAMGDRDACDTAVEELRDYIMKNEDEYLLEFDSFLFVRRFINEVVFKPGT